MKRISIILSIFVILSISGLALASPVYQGSFPQSGILDDFNRADEGPPPSSSWTTLQSGHLVLSNQIYGVSDIESNVSTTISTYGPDSEAYVTLTSLPGNTGWMMLNVRFQMGVVVGYSVYIYRDDDNGDTVTLYGDGELDSSPITLQAGDSFGVSAVGNEISYYHKPVGQAWEMLGSVTDSFYPDAGTLLIGSTYDGDPAMDDFGGGTVEAIPPTPTSVPTPPFLGPQRLDFAESFYLLMGPFTYLVAAAVTILAIFLFAVFVVLPPILRRI